MLGYRLAEKTGVEALWQREENCTGNLIYITSGVAGVEKPGGGGEGDVWGGYSSPYPPALQAMPKAILFKMMAELLFFCYLIKFQNCPECNEVPRKRASRPMLCLQYLLYKPSLHFYSMQQVQDG